MPWKISTVFSLFFYLDSISQHTVHNYSDIELNNSSVAYHTHCSSLLTVFYLKFQIILLTQYLNLSPYLNLNPNKCYSSIHANLQGERERERFAIVSYPHAMQHNPRQRGGPQHFLRWHLRVRRNVRSYSEVILTSSGPTEHLHSFTDSVSSINILVL